MGLGKIQHKSLEKGLTMKERKDMKAEESRNVQRGARQTVRQGSTPGRNGSKAVGAARNGTGPDGFSKPATVSKAPRAPAAEEKKVKKAALATTGYTGTARPRPSVSSKSGSASSHPGSTSKSEHRPRYGGALAPRAVGMMMMTTTTWTILSNMTMRREQSPDTDGAVAMTLQRKTNQIWKPACRTSIRRNVVPIFTPDGRIRSRRHWRRGLSARRRRENGNFRKAQLDDFQPFVADEDETIFRIPRLCGESALHNGYMSLQWRLVWYRWDGHPGTVHQRAALAFCFYS